MPFLYEEIDSLRKFGNITKMPSYISQNLNPNFELRPYQISAFENYITWFESERRPFPIQNLFHMATGSGKTLIMAGLILYLYKKGYRNFLFFVNLSNIVKKTKDNFLNTTSSKFLFSKEIIIDGEKVPVKEVSNFQYSDSSAINICFTTTQGLHSDMWFSKENSLSFDDFRNQKVVLISDEAHHLNASTKKMSKEEEENYHSWEDTVKTIFNANKDNVLLEFTATCELQNEAIKNEYLNKIVFNYPLSKFRDDLYSKEIKTLRCDIPLWDRVIQALVLSQYRLKVFQDNRLSVKPVILFKSYQIKDSKENLKTFTEKVENLTGDELKRVSTLTDNETMNLVWKYFEKKKISFEQLAQELKEDFSPNHCISANDESEAEEKQLALNSLEDESNPYRAVFEVKKLDEGWDVLNLFDIVRMYETRQSGSRSISKTTISEAQLIGRGSRYCPFAINKEQEKYKRKYDLDLENPLRICEELYYHCQIDSRYIGELHKALKEIGIDVNKTVKRELTLKERFKTEALYKNGYVFINDRVLKSRNDVFGLLPSVREKVYSYSENSGDSGEESVFGNIEALTEKRNELHTYRTTFSEIADINYSIVHSALCKYPIFKFNILKSYFPNLKSTREFIYSKDYLGLIKIEISSKREKPTPDLFYTACLKILNEISNKISLIEESYEGTKEFTAHYVHDIFKDKICNYTDPKKGEAGISQKDDSVPSSYRLDLSKEDWYVFSDNFGTSEEKAFVAYFKKYVEELKEKYEKIYLVRNERQLHIYSFDGGERFEPDFVLFLQKEKSEGFEQLQVFIEPKGSQLLLQDKWKEDFLLQLEENAVPVIKFVDDNKYKIWGFHFYNTDRDYDFAEDMKKL